ncbi:alanyl-tRNA synthetase [Dehalogenimonas sp. WBC-2]|nr:alanyl-tRNA synthetase [Dehalogenimonas sp. WBC-2]
MPMTGDQLRQLFLNYFAEKGHKIMPSASLIPHGDPTLLLTTAGMVQFKPYFLGKEKPPAKRLTTTQKCFRTTDIDSVGDSSHLTFFEMLGNFSVGDYFKKEAIDFAWEFVTERLKMPRERLWVTVYLDDDEAIRFWQDKGVPAERIVRLGEKDNFWGPAGDSGPCGPCSEIHYDFGEEAGCGEVTCGPACKCGRFCEIWNLVFMQFNQDTAGTRTPLPRPNIDTGMGLERLTAIMQGKSTVYKTDRFDYLLDKVADVSGCNYGQGDETDRAMRIIAEHSRGITFLIADGVIPSNEGRGYVLRRLLRRTALFGRMLGLKQPFMVPLVESVITQMGKVYPELTSRREFIVELVSREESRFAETLFTGMQLLEDMMAGEESQLQRKVTGEQAFKLYDTYGFPLDLTIEIASQHGFDVDNEGFNFEMERQREKARAGAKFVLNKETHGAHDFSPTCFTGYDTLSQYGTVDGIIKNNSQADSLSEGEQGGLILDKTAFYAEMGGQAGDTGAIIVGDNTFVVTNALPLSPGVTLHQGYVSRGIIRIGDEALANVDVTRRYDIARNHTATHLLQAALREVLGEHVQQRGSVVAADRLRFDFSHLKAVTQEELLKVEDIVNERIRENHPVNTTETGYQDALKTGVTALFGEKYGETVRVLAIGIDKPVSAELCGGTHIKATGEIGLFKIVSESSVGAGLRRIEAVTGRSTEYYIRQQAKVFNDKIEHLQTEIDHDKNQLNIFQKEIARIKASRLVSKAGTTQWSMIPTQRALRADAIDGTTYTVFVDEHGKSRFTKSINNGLEWVELPVAGTLSSIATSPVESNVIYISIDESVLKSIDNGNTFTIIGIAPAKIVSLDVAMVGGAYIIVAATSKDVFILNESLATIRLVRLGEPSFGELYPDATVTSIKMSPNFSIDRQITVVATKDNMVQIAMVSGSMPWESRESSIRIIEGGKLFTAEIPNSDIETLRIAADSLREDLGPSVIALGSIWNDKPIFLAMVTSDMVNKGYHAGNIIKKLSQIAGGGGGGKPNMAQGGGRDKDKLREALDAVSEFIR